MGWAHTDAELGILLERARLLLADGGQEELDLGVEPSPAKAALVGNAVVEDALFPLATGAGEIVGKRERVTSPQVVATPSRLLFDTLAGVYDDLGFDVLGDETFGDLVIARIVEPTSILDAGRVLTDLGGSPASEKTMRRTLARCVDREYRDKIAEACFARSLSAGDLSLVLYDVTVRHEALVVRAEVRDHRRGSCRSRGRVAEGSLPGETSGWAGSSPDKAVAGQHCQMV